MEIKVPVTFTLFHTLSPGHGIPDNKKEFKKLLLEQLRIMMEFEIEEQDDESMLKHKMGTPKIAGVFDWEEVETEQ